MSAPGELDTAIQAVSRLASELGTDLTRAEAQLLDAAGRYTTPTPPQRFGPSVFTGMPFNDPSTEKVDVPPEGIDAKGGTIYGDLRWPPGSEKAAVENALLVGGRSPLTAGDGAVVNLMGARPGTERATLSNVLVSPQTPSVGRNGIRGHRFELYNVGVVDTVDGVGIYAPAGGSGDANVRVRGLYVDRLAAFPDTINGRPWTHNDCLVLGGGGQVDLEGLILRCYARAYAGTPPAGSALALGYGGQGILAEDFTGFGHGPTVKVADAQVAGARQQTLLKPGVVLTYDNVRHAVDTYVSKVAPLWRGYWVRFGDTTTDGMLGDRVPVWADGPNAGQPLTVANKGLTVASS